MADKKLQVSVRGPSYLGVVTFLPNRERFARKIIADFP